LAIQPIYKSNPINRLDEIIVIMLAPGYHDDFGLDQDGIKEQRCDNTELKGRERWGKHGLSTYALNDH
jgi:hypothetical protein